jgi:hypothetical protein
MKTAKTIRGRKRQGRSFYRCVARGGKDVVAQPEKENLILNQNDPTTPSYTYSILLSSRKWVLGFAIDQVIP